ncbi:stress protein [Planococcus antarcticus DSM 14505]|uniref:Stress protein n=1 Tax=Planococcus antarcticus DSM 14505 TaxID=1185653 RepID=A0A1C7DDF3_9BACL|nr:TerD family protein [Planococcus antarcticus]ANU09447.1 hypothetical protein BBH88_03535 [Planococcus antarcticus DSM 14505]EIM06079.1 stress protein [Planococcus antarcticus DSM 14505]
MGVLVKGQKVDSMKAHPDLKQLKIGLGWDVSQTDSSIDLDAVALLVDAEGKVDGVVTLKQKNGPDLEVRLDEHRKGKRMCAITLIENAKIRP